MRGLLRKNLTEDTDINGRYTVFNDNAKCFYIDLVNGNPDTGHKYDSRTYYKYISGSYTDTGIDIDFCAKNFDRNIDAYHSYAVDAKHFYKQDK